MANPMKAIENETGIRQAVDRWRTALTQFGVDHDYSPSLIWLKDLSLWVDFGGWMRGSGYRYWIGIGNRLGGRTTRNLVVEVNPPDQGLPGRFQGLVAEDNAGHKWILHAGELNVGHDKINLKDSFDTGLDLVDVHFSDQSVNTYHRVLPLDIAPEGIARATQRFMNLCLRLKERNRSGIVLSDDVQRKAQLLEEPTGPYVIPPQPEKIVDRVHAEIFRALRLEIERHGYVLANETVGSFGPDLYTPEHKPGLLFEIKTNGDTSNFLKAVGQLVVYEKALHEEHIKFIVLPFIMNNTCRVILNELGIHLVLYAKTGGTYEFAWPDEFPLAKAVA